MWLVYTRHRFTLQHRNRKRSLRRRRRVRRRERWELHFDKYYQEDSQRKGSFLPSLQAAEAGSVRPFPLFYS